MSLILLILKIETFPESSPKSAHFGGIYKCVVTKQTSFYYRICQNDIEILTITDNRQSPTELLQELKSLT